MYGKIIDNKIKMVNDNTSRIECEHCVIFNPRTEEDFAKCGYKLLVPVELPEETETEGFYSEYEIIDGEIVGVVKSFDKTEEIA